MREQKKRAALESADVGQPTAKQTRWFRRNGWHPCKIDGRSVEVTFVGAGYGRAAGLVRPEDPEMGKCVVKVLCARSAQNQIEYETIQKARAAAGDSPLAEVLPRVRQVLLDGHSALLMTYAPEMREKVQGMLERFDKAHSQEDLGVARSILERIQILIISALRTITLGAERGLFYRDPKARNFGVLETGGLPLIVPIDLGGAVVMNRDTEGWLGVDAWRGMGEDLVCSLSMLLGNFYPRQDRPLNEAYKTLYRMLKQAVAWVRSRTTVPTVEELANLGGLLPPLVSEGGAPAGPAEIRAEQAIRRSMNWSPTCRLHPGADFSWRTGCRACYVTKLRLNAEGYDEREDETIERIVVQPTNPIEHLSGENKMPQYEYRRFFDKKHQTHYWFCQKTGETMWNRPDREELRIVQSRSTDGVPYTQESFEEHYKKYNAKGWKSLWDKAQPCDAWVVRRPTGLPFPPRQPASLTRLTALPLDQVFDYLQDRVRPLVGLLEAIGKQVLGEDRGFLNPSRMEVMRHGLTDADGTVFRGTTWMRLPLFDPGSDDDSRFAGKETEKGFHGLRVPILTGD